MDNDNMTARDKMTDEGSRRFEQEGRERAEDALHTQPDTTNHKAVMEASRLGGGDTYLVKSDLEDLDERVDTDGLDGRPSPMANADNPER
ncbi:hypothetical protein [Rhizobium rhizoryzae]|uniref:hypothetical protein n=1 Tax=Rhizobium rhizoryzae TaxID=451876 RepID=UPI00289BEF15|nr:hypothetical protein [Rhizobium rhizoryzae]